MQVVARLFPGDLLFPAGSSQEYSNTGYILLAAIIERITGEAFADALRGLVLTPAGLGAIAMQTPSACCPGVPQATTGRTAPGGTRPP